MSHFSATSAPAGLVSVILVNWNTPSLTQAAVNSLRACETATPLEIIIVDNASTDGSADYLERTLPGVRVIRGSENEGFARANNRGVAAASGQYVLLLNTDTVSHEEVLPRCLKALEDHAPALVACRLLNADGSPQLSAEKFPRLRDLAREVFKTTESVHGPKLNNLPSPGAGPTPVDWLCGAFLLTRRHTYLELGGLSREIFMYGEDVEFCWRARKQGVRSFYFPDVAITHLGGGGINHASLRSLLISDKGRLTAFRLMHGQLPALAFRTILMARSVMRLAAWGLTGLATGDSTKRRKAAHHARALWALAGLPSRGR